MDSPYSMIFLLCLTLCIQDLHGLEKSVILGISGSASVDCLEDKEFNHTNLFESQEFMPV